MPKVVVIFVHGDSLVDQVIDAFSHGQYSHTAIKINDGVVEALGVKDDGDKYPGVWLHDIAKYDNDPNVYLIEVDIPNLADAETRAQELIGTLYGYIDCIDGGVFDTTGIQLTADGELTCNCSETVVRVLRAGGFNVLPSVRADCITPNDLYKALKGCG